MHAKGEVKGVKASRHKGDGDNRSANACIDGLLWIGNTYKTVDDFLKEAQLRGVCRQLPFVPSWVVFGKTKIFLAHCDKHKVKSRGSVFGYFVLHRIEIITQNEDAQPLSETPIEIHWPSNGKRYATQIEEWKKKGYFLKEIKRRLEKMLQRNYLKDLARGKTAKEPWSAEFEAIMKSIDPETKKLIEQLIRKLIKKWLKRGCFTRGDSTKGEGGRMCSIRKGPGSVYAVDALCAAVHDTYQQLLPKYLSDESKKSGKTEQKILDDLFEENQESWENWVKYKRNHKWTAQDLLDHYKGPFYDAVKKHFRPDRLPKYPIDPRLRSKARYYGELIDGELIYSELIVFNKPFPIIERAPRAAFRGICRIDGDKLIEQIAKHTGKEALFLTIYFCKEKEPPSRPLQKIVTKEELATWLAEELHVSKACATSFFDKVSIKAIEQLQDFKPFKLPGIGTISRSKKARKKIKFSPAEAILSIKSRKKID